MTPDQAIMKRNVVKQFHLNNINIYFDKKKIITIKYFRHSYVTKTNCQLLRFVNLICVDFCKKILTVGSF